MRIAIVNDMPLAREALRRVVSSVPTHRVAWTARDGSEAYDRARGDRPDLILMDLIMPEVDGAEATRRIMAECPCAILVVTSTVAGNMGKVYEAMGHGALDAVDTPAVGQGGRLDGASLLLEKIATIGKLLDEPPALAGSLPIAGMRADRRARDLVPLVVLGASTGGPKALADVLGALPADWPACAIVIQHVDEAFAPGLATWLAEQSRRPVELVRDGRVPAPGLVLLAETNDHLALTPDRRLHYTIEPGEYPFRPSVDVFFGSVAAHWPEPGVAVLLTGMGRDGAQGLLNLRKAGWHTIAQDERTSVIWGMPKAAAELGAAVEVLPIHQVAGAIAREVGQDVQARERERARDGRGEGR